MNVIYEKAEFYLKENDLEKLKIIDEDENVNELSVNDNDKNLKDQLDKCKKVMMLYLVMCIYIYNFKIIFI